MPPEDQHEQPFDPEEYEKWLNSGCTCGPDYFDNFCPRHGNKPPEDKWKELRSRPEAPCDACKGNVCPHGFCECSEEYCPDCWKREQLEREAKIEAAYQETVIGPLFEAK